LNIDLTLELIDLLNLNILFRMNDLIELMITQSESVSSSTSSCLTNSWHNPKRNPVVV